jgi:hypothetical protein
MNKWTELSVEYANQRSYLDDLFQVYPTIPDGIREINEEIWDSVEKAYKKQDNNLLIKELLKLDFVARFNGKYVIGEAKFLTDFGGHQNAQFADAISTIETPNVKAGKIAILDGVLYIKGNNKMYKAITETYKNHNIMSALIFRNYLYQL